MTERLVCEDVVDAEIDLVFMLLHAILSPRLAKKRA
jgi:hypothetical protein